MRERRGCSVHTAALTMAIMFCLIAHVLSQGGEPPPGYPLVLRDVRLAFPTQDGTAIRPVEDYLQIIGLPQPSALHTGPTWTYYARVEPMILDGALRLWLSGHFHSVWVDVMDDPFPNGALARRVVFNVVERVRPGPAPDRPPEPPPGYELPPPSHARVYPRSRHR